MDRGDASIGISSDDTTAEKKSGSAMSPEDKEQLKANIASLQQQRQQALKSGNSPKATDLGTQMQRMQNMLNP